MEVDGGKLRGEKSGNSSKVKSRQLSRLSPCPMGRAINSTHNHMEAFGERHAEFLAVFLE